MVINTVGVKSKLTATIITPTIIIIILMMMSIITVIFDTKTAILTTLFMCVRQQIRLVLLLKAFRRRMVK